MTLLTFLQKNVPAIAELPFYVVSSIACFQPTPTPSSTMDLNQEDPLLQNNNNEDNNEDVDLPETHPLTMLNCCGMAQKQFNVDLFLL